MKELVIYGCFAEGFMRMGTVEISPQKPWLRTFEITEAYASVDIDINCSRPVILDFEDEGFASGFEVEGVVYLHFEAGHVPNGVLIREA